MRRWCDLLVRLAAPLVPADIRRDWVREWRAELAFTEARAAQRGRGMPAGALWRAAGAIPHAAWLRSDQWRLEMIIQDLKHALRALRRKPGFTAVTLLTLAIGIGANAAIFGAVRAVLLRPLPFPNPDALIAVSTTTLTRPDVAGGSSSPSDFADWRRDLKAFTDVAAITTSASALTGDGPAEQVPDANVTGGFFNLLGVAPLYGRPLLPEDDAIGGPQVVVLSYDLWVRRFGSARDVVGKTLAIDAQPVRIVGVMPRGFNYPLGAEIWIPLRFTEDDLRTQRGAQYLDVIARLRPGVTLASAQEEMRAYGRRLAELYPRNNKDRSVALFGMRDSLVGDVRTAMLLLLGAVGFVLLIVCVNVANLFLTRALGRQRELAVRAALGAGRARLVRGLLVESLVVGVGGGVAGLILAVWATGAIATLDTGVGIPLLDQTRVDGAVVAFAVALSLVAAILFGTLPAWHTSARLDVAQRIREDSASSAGDRHRHRLRSALIVLETSMAVVLLVGAGLLMRTFLSLSAVALGFEADRVQTFNVSLPATKYVTPAARATFMETVLSRLSAHPETEAAGAIFGLPLTNFGYSMSMSTIDGRKIDDVDEQRQRSLQLRIVTSDYFRAMGIPVRRGRGIGPDDRLGATPSIVVNETAAARLWPETDPLGHDFTLGTRMGQGGLPAGGTVVGVVADVRDVGPARPVRPTVYLSHAQFPVNFLTVVIKTRGPASAAVEPARAMLKDLDPDLPIYQVRTMEQLSANVVAQPRLYVLLLGLFAGTAVLLAAIGIYGVLAHSVSQRTREIGIRLALGAPRGQVVRAVVGQSTLLASVGLIIGLALAAGAGRFVRGLLHGVQPIDGVTYACVAAGLLVVSVVAALVPAQRAAQVDPITALRHD